MTYNPDNIIFSDSLESANPYVAAKYATYTTKRPYANNQWLDCHSLGKIQLSLYTVRLFVIQLVFPANFKLVL